MIKRSGFFALLICSCLVPLSAQAQEAAIQHGFLFIVGEDYSVDEKTFGIYEDGNTFADLIKENQEALEKFESYGTWHVTANVMTGLSLAAFTFGAATYMPAFEKELPESAGLISFLSGGGLLLVGMVCEFIAWGSISSAAEIYNSDLMDEGPAYQINALPTPMLAVLPDGGHLSLAWNF